MRYAVLDTLGDWEVTEVAGIRGNLLDRFHCAESAYALALQRLAHGYGGVVVVDSLTGEVLYRPSDEGHGGDAPPRSVRRPSRGPTVGTADAGAPWSLRRSGRP